VLISSHIFHYAGHEGWARRGLMDSAFKLDSEMKICDIIHAPLRHPVLAYLPHCTGATSRSNIELATGMLLSGFKSIVASIRCVAKHAALAMYTYHQLHRALRDEDAPVLAEAFYQSWLANARDGLVSVQDIPYALDDACAVLRAALGRRGLVRPDRWGALIHIGA
jgi:hypothetical protein